MSADTSTILPIPEVIRRVKLQLESVREHLQNPETKYRANWEYMETRCVDKISILEQLEARESERFS